MRNKLAHEWRFESESAEVQEWADSVLKNIPYMMDFRRTKRTRVIHAIAALAGAVLEQGQKGK
ncbi:hypothetical protein [Thiomicrorhabdus sp.]|uniref:hypothetical protein n=1 Tax=Thiomicrorhabdus sp. TaxID=2039724 RepID=UPI0029C97D76|nr:hypothetical protein [Thiomicrorhabdus sp.]